MPPTEYRCRASIADKGEVLWRALPDRLEQIGLDGTVVMTVPYRAVKSLRLAFAPGRFRMNRFVMELTGTRSSLLLNNLHFAGIGNFEDRSDSFFALVREVVAGVRRESPDAVFLAGEAAGPFWLLLFFNVAAFSMLALVVAYLPIVPGGGWASVITKFAIILFSLPVMMAWMVNSRPRQFDPETDLENVIAARIA